MVEHFIFKYMFSSFVWLYLSLFSHRGYIRHHTTDDNIAEHIISSI